MPEIKIKAIARNHSQFLMVLGTISLILTIALSHHFWQEFRLALIFMLLVSIVIIFIGYIKRLEPDFSYTLTPEAIHYRHKYGNWTIAWRDIRRIGPVKVNTGFYQQQLPYIGIKLNEFSSLFSAVSPRLASRLPHEQRPLLTMAVSQQLIPLAQAQINFMPFKPVNQRPIKGPVAMFLHHTKALETAYGYHLFLPVSSMDRSIDEFLALLNGCKHYQFNYPQQ
ncbi:DUF2982 domain-containing protein [Colwellia sp. MEBiC06753]